mmetsp:Transcript_27661/g.36292  ORF Transcript_27661/g.36292 Transcript_27661/m.36292 type:complete len:552 (-) Transcript_27661:84-1739(-)
MFLKGSTFTCCGRLSESHEVLKAKIEALGGNFSSNVVKEVSHMICSEEAFNLKYDQVQYAQKKGVIIVHEDFFDKCVKSRSLLNIHRGKNMELALSVPTPQMYLDQIPGILRALKKTPKLKSKLSTPRKREFSTPRKITPVKKSQKKKFSISTLNMKALRTSKPHIMKPVDRETKADIAAKLSPLQKKKIMIDLNRNWYQYKDGKILMNVNVPLRLAEGKQSKVVFVIDKSGSMCSNNGMSQVKQFIQTLITSKKVINPSFIAYNCTAQEVSKEDLLGMQASGGTCFESAFVALNNWISSKVMAPGTGVEVVFMTDGLDNGSQNIQKAIADFQQTATRLSISTTIHAIGFRPNHNIKFLEQIRNSGHKSGVYRYAGQYQLHNKFEELFDFLDASVNTSMVFGDESLNLTGYCDSQAQVVSFNALHKLQSLKVSSLCQKKLPISVIILGKTIETEHKEVDDLFNLQLADSIDIISTKDIQTVQQLLQSCSNTDLQRADVSVMKKAVDTKLERMSGLLQNKKPSSNAEMNSLRFDAKFRENHRRRMEWLARAN